MKSLALNIFYILILCESTLLMAFEYEIENKALEGFSVPGHETITSMAIDCLIRHSPNKPKNCLNNTTFIGQLDNTVLLDIPSIPKLNAQELLDASSFPDDPGRVSDGLVKGAKAYINKENECDVPNWKTLFLTTEGYYHDITGGLFCNSHFGVLQFWHSMASIPQPVIVNKKRVKDEKGNVIVGGLESYESTMAKVLAWANLTYEISIDKKYKILKEDYCVYFEKLKKDKRTSEMAFAFRPNDEILVNPPLFHCKENDNGDKYKVSWIFNNVCNGLTGTNCDKFGGENAWRRWQIAALGSLLHLIQDSYSQSHVLRVSDDPSDSNVVARIDCSEVKGFMSYSLQNSDRHNKADVFPLKIAKNCFNGNIDDVVTASAKTLWYVQHGAGKCSAGFMKYLKTSVFKSPYKNGQEGPLASSGKYFGLKSDDYFSKDIVEIIWSDLDDDNVYGF